MALLPFVPSTGIILNEAQAVALGDAEDSTGDTIDFLIMALALAGYGVVSGCQVTAQASPDMTVAVSEGIVQAGAQQVHVPGGSTVAFSANATFKKYAFVEINPTVAVASQIQRNSGSATASPIYPTPTVTGGVPSIVLAAIPIPANTTQITSSMIIDKRMPINSSYSTAGKLTLSNIDTTRYRP